MKNNHKGQLSTKACSFLALELEGSQNLHTTSNCECLKLFGIGLLVLVVNPITYLIQQVFSYIAATIFPLEKIRYTKQMNVAQRFKIVA